MRDGRTSNTHVNQTFRLTLGAVIMLLGYCVVGASAVSTYIHTERGLIAGAAIILAGGVLLVSSVGSHASAAQNGPTSRWITIDQSSRLAAIYIAGGIITIFFPIARPGDIDTEYWLTAGALMSLAGGALPIITAYRQQARRAPGAKNDDATPRTCRNAAPQQSNDRGHRNGRSRHIVFNLTPVGGWATVVGACIAVAALTYDMGYDNGSGNLDLMNQEVTQLSERIDELTETNKDLRGRLAQAEAQLSERGSERPSERGMSQ